MLTVPATGPRKAAFVGAIGRRGAAAVEFAMVMPVLIVMLLGLADLVPTLFVKVKVGNATHSVADLTAQFARMQTSDLADVFAGGSSVLLPFSGAPLALRVTSIASDGNNRSFVYWSCGQTALPAYPAKSPVSSLPTGSAVSTVLLQQNFSYGGYNYRATDTTVVMVEATYTYKPPTGFVLKGPQILTATVFALPRLATFVAFPWNGDPNATPNPPTASNRTGSVTLGNGVACSYAY